MATNNVRICFTIPRWYHIVTEELLSKWEEKSGHRYNNAELEHFIETWFSKTKGIEFDDARVRHKMACEREFIAKALEYRKQQAA